MSRSIKADSIALHGSGLQALHAHRFPDNTSSALGVCRKLHGVIGDEAVDDVGGSAPRHEGRGLQLRLILMNFY
jgi:hypothetical protein